MGSVDIQSLWQILAGGGVFSALVAAVAVIYRARVHRQIRFRELDVEEAKQEVEVFTAQYQALLDANTRQLALLEERIETLSRHVEECEKRDGEKAHIILQLYTKVDELSRLVTEK